MKRTGLSDMSAISPKPSCRGWDITPEEAVEMISRDPEHTFMVDVRTPYEYQNIGHPMGSCNVPWMFYTSSKIVNANFCSDLMKRFDPGTDILLMLCRSGERSAAAASAAVEGGFPADRVFNVIGGIEGDDEYIGYTSKRIMNFKRMMKRWLLEGLPWTFDIRESLVYGADLKK